MWWAPHKKPQNHSTDFEFDKWNLNIGTGASDVLISGIS